MVHFLKLMNNQKSIFDIQNTSNDTSVFLSTQLYQLRIIFKPNNEKIHNLFVDFCLRFNRPIFSQLRSFINFWSTDINTILNSQQQCCLYFRTLLDNLKPDDLVHSSTKKCLEN